MDALQSDALTPVRRRIHAAAMRLFAEQGVTQVTVSELATAAGVARGTVYSNVPDIDGLFEEVAAELVREMVDRVMLAFAGVDDVACRLSIGVRLYIRRAHEEPLWGRFMSRFGLSMASLQAVLTSDPATNLSTGIAQGRYSIKPEQLRAMVGMLTGSTLAAMVAVLEGHQTWREAGSDVAEFLLVALGPARDEARELARVELPR
ncbi:TetR/AcrR family transcriptional regulator [Variovorax ureilyticus]|uniref:TetR/AcrR family transcriptional regulator n=1 Tax=Variovorax ureilyticus TaxID=1836198 RepID=UPI003D675E52